MNLAAKHLLAVERRTCKGRKHRVQAGSVLLVNYCELVRPIVLLWTVVALYIKSRFSVLELAMPVWHLDLAYELVFLTPCRYVFVV